MRKTTIALLALLSQGCFGSAESESGGSAESESGETRVWVCEEDTGWFGGDDADKVALVANFKKGRGMIGTSIQLPQGLSERFPASVHVEGSTKVWKWVGHSTWPQEFRMRDDGSGRYIYPDGSSGTDEYSCRLTESRG